MKINHRFEIYANSAELPESWDDLVDGNIFLSTQYLSVLDLSAPTNMICKYIGIFKDNELCGVAIAQFLDLNKLQSFGDRDRRTKSAIRNFIFKNFNSHVLFIGNNMLTGQNAFKFSDKISKSDGIQALLHATEDLKQSFKNSGKRVHITTVKDFDTKEVSEIQSLFHDYYKFAIHPNMIFNVDDNWKTFGDYTNALSKKYRDQYKRSTKRASGIVKRKMDLAEIVQFEETINSLYFHVAKNAPFNTFFLADNHFRIMKSKLGINFKFYGYFDGPKMIGFNTLIKKGDTLDTYFLGYASEIQREKMLYLNMLYDMVGYAIKKNFKTIIFARTALEIKSSIGAMPIPMYGFLQHRNAILQRNMDSLFKYFEPKLEWKNRNPFK